MENETVVQTEQYAELIELVGQQNDILAHIYANSLFVIGVTGAVLVLILLYKFIRMFY